jgi:hypothetical protein
MVEALTIVQESVDFTEIQTAIDSLQLFYSKTEQDLLKQAAVFKQEYQNINTKKYAPVFQELHLQYAQDCRNKAERAESIIDVLKNPSNPKLQKVINFLKEDSTHEKAEGQRRQNGKNSEKEFSPPSESFLRAEQMGKVAQWLEQQNNTLKEIEV